MRPVGRLGNVGILRFYLFYLLKTRPSKELNAPAAHQTHRLVLVVLGDDDVVRERVMRRHRQLADLAEEGHLVQPLGL